MKSRHQLPLRGGLRAGLAAFISSLALAGCSALAPAPNISQPEAPAPAPEDSAALVAARAITAFETAQRQRGEEAERQGHWALAASAWDALLALNPADASLLARRQRAEQAAESLAALRSSQARLALQLGDIDAAHSLMLKALSAQPGSEEVFAALRALESEKVHRALAAQTTRHSLSPELPEEFEHASFLAAQGDLAAAIGLLQRLAEASQTSRQTRLAARRRVADLYLRQAELQAENDLVQAMKTARQALQADSGLSAARVRLREWEKLEREQKRGRQRAANPR